MNDLPSKRVLLSLSASVIGEILAGMTAKILRFPACVFPIIYSDGDKDVLRVPVSNWSAVADIELRPNFDSWAANPYTGEVRIRRAFTIIELLISIAIIALLVALVLPKLGVGAPTRGIAAGVVSDFSFDEKNNIWRGDIAMEGVQQIQTGKTSYHYEPLVRHFWVTNDTALVRQIERTMGHIAKLQYRRKGGSMEIIGAEDTTTPER
jgi:prepilin-type N-terminal cleavage/methylation domain-containing protein